MNKDLIFTGKEHESFFNEKVNGTGSESDPYRMALFYVMGINEDARKHVSDLYDFSEGAIKSEGLKAPWQTSGSICITRLAFNLYNGFTGEGARYYSPYDLFSGVDREVRYFMFEAIKYFFDGFKEDLRCKG